MASLDDELKVEIKNLYDSGLTPSQISKKTKTPYATVYALTKVKNRINPETRKPYKSLTELMDYNARRRINPETGKHFKSLNELTKFQDKRRSSSKLNQNLSSLISYKLTEKEKNASWLANEIGVSRQAVSKYLQGKYLPSEDILKRIFNVLDLPYTSLDDLIGKI
jgi:DNA-binding XRE family transcriptional regulator